MQTVGENNIDESETSVDDFFVECPEFEDVIEGQIGNSKRDYAHPFDSIIINFLDNPAVNAIFKQIIETCADFSYGSVIASGVPVTNSTYPEINILVDDCVKKLNIKKPHVLISNSLPQLNATLNAVTFGSDENPCIVLTPLLMNTMTPQQLKFIIGHECGHIAMGHVVYHVVVNLATYFATGIPLVGKIIERLGSLPLMAWSRRSEITADRAGLLCCGSCEIAQRTLLQLGMPFMDASEIDIDEYVQNSNNYFEKGYVRRFSEFKDSHPIIPKRIESLKVFHSSEKYYRIIEQDIPVDAISDAELETKIEKIVKVM